MKLIKAYIRYRKFEDAYHALRANGFCCMTMVDCEGTGSYSDRESDHVSQKYPFTDAYRVVKLEVFVKTADVSKVVRLIRESARTGYRGDGMILVSSVDEVYKIRTDEDTIDAI